MCGIVGYVGGRPALPIILSGLKRLEYRGYDSAGVALVHDGKLWWEKKKGKIADLEMDMDRMPLDGFQPAGIGHTRWATHGAPSDANAHPHFDCQCQIAVVHNGIIENYSALKQELTAKGHTFRSETDSEVLAHLIEMFNEGDLVTAKIGRAHV